MPGVFVTCLVTMTKYQTETLLKKKDLKWLAVLFALPWQGGPDTVK